ncbi:hypothetical protein [Entomomonas asaccharolytica]|uniref:Uncharacterized protein n=1 Tax=Entomomonas asaccharolytica TaxID=2785331 RepID=A0A974NCQ3_9GAMM|nr:hypothetical protein [Entomomonas asaccharolytica]QQP84300.1 hypothetical protein JHT90_07620 [Entomomonas asaccharolytica]
MQFIKYRYQTPEGKQRTTFINLAEVESINYNPDIGEVSMHTKAGKTYTCSNDPDQIIDPVDLFKEFIVDL